MAASAEFITVANNKFTTFVNADGTTTKNCWSSSAAKGGLVRGILVATDDVAAVDVQLWYKPAGGSEYLQTTIRVPATSGSVQGVAPVNVLNPTVLPFLDEEPNRAWFFQQNAELRIKVVAAVTAAKTVWVSVYGGDY